MVVIPPSCISSSSSSNFSTSFSSTQYLSHFNPHQIFYYHSMIFCSMKMDSKGSYFDANLTLQTQDNCREVSFSCYLNKSEENMIRELANQASELAKSKKDDEIGVFRAEKYFKGEIENGGNKNDLRFIDANKMHPPDEKCIEFDRKDNKADQTNVHTNIPSVRSSSSCNSRSGLLTLMKQSSQTIENGSKTRRFLARFGCNCINRKSTQITEERLIQAKEILKPDEFSIRMFDSDKKIDQVSTRMLNSDHNPDQSSIRKLETDKKNDQVSIRMLDSDQKPDQLSIRMLDPVQKAGQVSSKFTETAPKNNYFSFPVLNSNNSNSNSSSNSKSGNLAGNDQGDNNNGQISHGNKLSLLNDWDMDIPTEHEKYISSSGTYNNDADSDSSSDLFEIESFSPNRDGSFSAHRKSEFFAYPPSEVSIDWSVVTASAADFSVASDYDSVRTGGGGGRRNSGRNGQVRGKKDERKKRSGILSGCANHKAVRVAGDESKVGGGAVGRRRRLPESMAVGSLFRGG